MKRKKLVLLTLLALALIAVIVFLVLKNRTLVFCYIPRWGMVSAAHRELAREIYADNKDALSRILVAEGSRNNQCIRWVFESDEGLTPQKESVILSRLFEHLQEPNGNYLPHTWEVFFCSNKAVVSAYVSIFGYDRIIRDNAFFSEWEPVQDVKNVLSYDVLTKIMLRDRINSTMYPGYNHLPIAERTPVIPSPSR